jgi:hypothetical protein
MVAELVITPVLGAELILAVCPTTKVRPDTWACSAEVGVQRDVEALTTMCTICACESKAALPLMVCRASTGLLYRTSKSCGRSASPRATPYASSRGSGTRGLSRPASPGTALVKLLVFFYAGPRNQFIASTIVKLFGHPLIISAQMQSTMILYSSIPADSMHKMPLYTNYQFEINFWCTPNICFVLNG